MAPSVSTGLQNGVLLCVDDNPDLLECEKAFLESFGYSVYGCPQRRKRTGTGLHVSG